MAAATVNRRRNEVDGNKRIHLANLTAGNNDTYIIPGIKIVDAYSLDPTTNATLGATISGSTLTFASGGSLTFSLIAIGN